MRTIWFDAEKPEIKRMWQETFAGTFFFSKLRRITRFYRGFCKAKACALRSDENALIIELEALTRASHANPLDATMLHD